MWILLILLEFLGVGRMNNRFTLKIQSINFISMIIQDLNSALFTWMGRENTKVKRKKFQN